MGKDSALKLYNALKSQGKYTKSFAEFQGILGDKQRRQKLYSALSNDGQYTKSFSDFSKQFSSDETAPRTAPSAPQKKSDFVADTINMLRTPSSQYTRPQPSKAAGTFEMPSKYDIYHNMPDAVKRHQTPTPLKPEAVMPSVPSNAAESVWAAADKAESADVREKVDEGWSWRKIMQALSSGASVTGGLGDDNAQALETTSVAHLKTHDLQKLSDQAWAALGSKQQQSIINDTYRYLKEQYPDADDKALVDAARKMARAKSDEQMYNLAVEKNMPKSVGEFFLRKAAAASSFGSLSKGYASMMAGTSGDMEAEDTALQKYGAKHKVADIAGSVAGFAVDPLTYASGAVGGAATKVALWTGGKVLSEAAARKMSQTLGGKLLLGAVGGAANFGTFEAGGEALNQYKWGGTLDVDPETGRYVVGDFSVGKIASQMRHGLTMGGLTGAFGTWLGNVSTKAAQATTSTLGKLGVRAGELGVGLVGEGTIFATPEFISTYGDYNDVIKSVSDKNSPNYIADDKERSKYIAELKAQRGERMMDIWQDNLAMIAGFKAQHAIKSAGRTISELAASRRGKVGFVERMGRMLDGHPSLALSKEEQAELDKHGYGDLTQMVKEYKAYAQKDGDLPYNKITQLLNDKNVSEAARAKMYYYVTGHSLPMSAVIASNVIDNGDKTYTVQSLGDNGVITSRTYGNRKRADYEKARIDRQAELNGVAMAEQMFDNMDKAERLKAVCTRLAQDKGVSPETLLWLTRKDPKQMTAAEKRWVKEIEDAANEDAPQGENATVRHIKGVILGEYGVDVDKALRKAADSRTEAEKAAISAYNNELAQAVAERKNAISQGETTDAYRRGYEADTQGMRDAYVAQMYEPSEDNAETLKGVEAQITESAKYQAALERDELKQMTHKDGSTHLATLKEKDKDGNGKQVYIVDGDIVMKGDGSGIDADASSKSVIIYDPATGEKKMVSPTAVDGIESLGEVKTAEQTEAEINARMQDTIQRGKDWLVGNVANPVGMQIQLGDGRIATIEAMHEDGKSAIATLPDGTQFLVSKDVLQRIVNNGQYADYKARRDAEASKREAEQGTESAPETATEGGQPLPEEASTKEEESREYAQGDVFDVVVDGQKMHAEIVSPKDADGRFVVNVDDGESMRTLYVTPEELAAMEYREEPSAKAEETRLATEGSSEKALERGEQPTEEHTPTALERIPRDEKGNAQFHDVDTETAWDGLVEMSGNEETAHKVAEASLANAEKRLKAAKALKEKGETPEELLRSIKENEAAVAEAQRTVDAWKAIVGEKARREEDAKAEAERIATEKTEAERKAAEERERAEAEEKTRIEAEKKEAERIAAEKAEEERKTKEEERKERDENGQPFVVSSDGTTTFGEITEDTGLTAAPIKLSEGFQDANTGKGYGLVHIEANHGEQIRQAGFTSVKEFVSFVATHYDPDNIRVGKRRDDGSDTFLIQVTDTHDNTLFIELSKDGSYWNVNSGGIFRKGYSNKKETVAKTEPQQPTNAVSSDSSLSANVKDGITNAEPNGEPTVSLDKGTTLPADQQTSDKENTKKVADSEGENTLKAKIEAASAEVNTGPTEAQKEAGNYKKGHVQVGTFDITIEQPEGSIRRGTDADGKQWEIKMHNTYGYFRGTEGVDGDHIDVFLSNDIDGWNGRKVFVVDQYNPDGTFDEHKVMLGFNDMDEAKSDYLANYEKGWENGRRITVSTTNLEDFEKWIDSSHRKTKPFSEYSSVNKETVANNPANDKDNGSQSADTHSDKQHPSADKGGEKPEKKQEKQSVFDKAKEIADKEEKKRKAEADKPKQKPLTEAERKDAEEVAGALGYRVEWVDTMEENGTIDADRKVIRIAKDAENPLVQVLGHEVAHGVKRMDGGKFRTLQKAAMEVVGEKEWNERIEKKRKLNAYAEGKLAEEVTCDIVGEALNNKDALKRLAESLRGEKGILARLRDAVARMVEYFKNRGDKEGVRRMKAADKLLAEFESALKEGVAPEQVKPEGVDRSEREGKKDDKTLYGVHNISEEKLRKALKLGGLANPSVAVIDISKNSHEGFGEISLILPSEKVAKRTGKNAGTWQGDAWTPTYPQIERRMSNKGAEKASKDVLSVPSDMYSEVRIGLDRWLDSGEANSAMAYMFLHEKGVAPEPKKIQPKFSDEAYNELKSITAGNFNIYGISKADAQKVLAMYIDAYFDGDKDLYEDKTKAWLEKNRSIVDAGDKGGMRYAIAKENVKLYDEYGFNYRGVQTFVRDVEYDHRNTGVDMNATLNEVEDYIKTNSLTDEFNTWQEGKEKEYGIKEVIFDGFTPSGNRRYIPNTLENVSKIMKKQGRNGATGAWASFPNFAARLMPSYGTLEDIRSKKGLLTSDREKIDDFREMWSKVFFELGMKCQPDATGTFDDYGFDRLSEAAMTSDPQAFLKQEYNVDFSDEDTKRLKKMVKAIKEEYPAMYFETKFERPVMLNEFAAAVVPKGIGDDVRKGLEDAGLVLYEYDPAKKGDRERAANEASASDGIRFNRSEKTELTEEERELRDNLVERMRKGGLDVVTDSEEMQRVIDTENERTRMMGAGSVREHRVYHGSGADFDAFDHSHMGEGEGAQAYGWGTYVTEVEGIGRTYAEQNATTHNDALRALQHDVDAISDQLNRHRDDLKYDEEQLKRANEWRAEAELDYELFKDEAEKLKEKYGEASPEYRNHLFNDIYTDEMKRAQSSVKSTEESIQYRKEKIAELEKALKDKQAEIDELPKEFPRHLYTVEIPDDNGSNYLDWNGHPAESLLKDVGSFLESNGFERVQDSPVRYEKGESTVVLNPNATGADLYAELQEALGNDKKASQALAESGCIGIKYPADNMRGGRKDGAKNYVIFNENDAKITDHTRFLRTASGEVYGLVKDGRIYLDPKVATSETAVHEYTHLWGDMLRRKDSEQWSHTVKELKNSVLWEEVKESYPELKTDDEIADEVLSTFSGRRGAERLREEARRVADGDGGVFTKAKAIETLERVKEAIARFWGGVAKMFGINRYRSAEELADMAMRDLLDSKNPMKDESGMRKRGEVGETLATSGTYFSGGGLLEAGLKGVIDPKVAVEFSEKIAGVYADNHGNHIVVADVRDVDPKKLVGAVDGGEVQYFHASPVCKNFSKAKREGGEVELDKETALSTAEFIAKTRPKVVTIENVKGYRNSEALKIITDELTRQGYDWDADVYNTADYGGYTKRERLIVRAKRDGKLPPKPEKLPEELRKKGWYSAVEDLIPHLEEKKTGVPQGTDERLKNSGIDYRTIDKPLYVFGRGYANKTVGHAFADELLPTLTTGGGDIIIMPDGRVLKASPRVLARVTGLPDTYKMPETDQLSHTIVGNGIPTQLTEGVIAPLLDNAIPSAERATKRESVFDVADRVSQNLEERTRNMFVGEKGATEADKAEEVSTRLDNLSVARRMEEAGKDAKTIKMATGWERGSDGKWRYETSDIKPKPFEEWMNKKNLKLGDIIDSDSGLFEMYPELKDFKVTRGKGKSTNAAIYTGLGKIEINFSKFKPYMSIPSNREKIDGILHRVINHEIQHAIQDSEGFAQGVSPNAFSPDAPIGKLREMEEADGRMVERYNAMSYTEKALGEGVRLKERILENRKEYNALASKYRFGMDGYTRAAGEVEARNTEKRIGMTEEERRASLASETEDVAREDQILLRQGDIMRSEAAATPLKGDEALTALDSIFGENEGSAIPPKISSFAKFKNLFKKPVRTFLGELVQVKDEVWNKILRNNRQDITGTVLPTIENADFAIRDTDGSTLYVKRFKGDGQERMYNVVVVNKHGEVEDYISSVHIKRDNNLRNKIKKGAELFLPNARTTDGTMSRNNSTPDAKVANYSETAKPRFSRKPGESIFDYASRVSDSVDRSVRERVSARDEYEKKVKSKGFQTKEALQNSMLGLQEFMYAIDHASGNKRYIEDIPDFENPILGENRLSSVNKEEMHQVAKTQFKPLMSAVAKLSGNGKESGELYDYMFAKHGLERDAVMRQREAQKEFDKYQKANPKGTKTIGDFVASLEGKDYAGLTALTAEDGRVKSIQSQIDTIDEQMKATDDQLLLRNLGGQKKRLKVDLLNAARDAADDIRKAFESNPSHDRSDINELWKRVNEVNGSTLRKLYESGLLTKEAYDDISSMYTNYIPMRGFDQTTSADAYAYLTHGDSAFNAPIKTAKGRSSKADNPIAYMQAMAESAIMQGNRNVLVKQKMLNFVRNHPSDLASVSDVWLQYDSVADEWKPVFPDNIDANDSASVVAKKMEAFEDKMKQMAEKHPDLVQRSNEAPDIPYKVVEKGQLNEHQVLVKQNGKSYIITVNGSPRAAQAANGLTNPDTDLTGAVGKVFEGAEALNRQLSSLYTTLNPDFIGSNYVRDALYSNTMVYVKEGAKYGGSFNFNFAKYNPAEMANLYARYNKGSLDTSNETHKLFLEFMQNGGETGFVNLKQIEKRKSEIAKAIKRDGEISAAQIWGGLNDAIDFANRAVENSARFAAYVTSRRSGRSVGRSVYDAKEISVNFNRKGSGSKFMGAEGQTKAGNAAAFVSGAGRGLYIFWNAGIQGLTNFSRQIGRHPGRALTLASLLFGFGALMSYLGSNDDDDENNYFNLPKYIRRSNVCYKIGDLFVTIPLPVEYRAFYGLGELAISTLAGKESGTTKDIAKEAFSQISQLFPIDFAEGGGGLHALIPSAVKPIVEAETNTAWTGLPIYKDNDFNKNMPEYTKVYKTANGYLVEIARALNDATGGNKYKKGFIDINPAKMEYVLKGMLGGAFSFPDKLVKTTETILGEREFDWRNTPFANRFVKNADERTEYKALNEQYFKLKDEMDVVKQQLKGFEKEADAGNEKYEKALRQLEDSKDYERLELFKDYEKEFKGLNDELKELRMSPDYDKAEEKELQKEIAELQRQLIDEMREIKK